MDITLTEMAVGEKGRVVGFKKADKAYREKLMAMGLTKGIEFTVKRVAPLGDPVEINVRGFSLTLRKGEASVLTVQKEVENG
ncbi:MAG: ferrous iron transport protein A [Candidatus Brocadia sp.]|nr:ferrous iron transport protein A [Candidatus Brocadia sp.]